MERDIWSPTLLALTCVLLLGLATRATGQDAPLQAVLLMGVEDSGVATTAKTLEGGTVRVRARVTNLDDRTARVVVRFRYSIPPDTIALDEIIDHILIQTEKLATPPTGEVHIDPNDINLNPNGRSLRYEVTMNRPEGHYRTRVRVNGNYE